MRTLVALLCLAMGPSLFAKDLSIGRIYTPEVVWDHQNQGPKGAVQLLWQKASPDTVYELEVSNGERVYRARGEKHFAHIMIYFNKNYQWRVRKIKGEKTHKFSAWRPLKVVPSKKKAKRWAASFPEYEVQELQVDHGGE
ncbi:MAG: hypothetical protein AAF203_09380 [Pseudomonadota bacterium]